MDRRQFLGAVGVGLFAGCLGGGEGTETAGGSDPEGTGTSEDGSAPTPEPTASPTPTQTETASPTPTAPIDDFQPFFVEGYELRPQDVMLAKGTQYAERRSQTPDAGKMFVFVKVEVRNTAAGAVDGISRSDWALVAENSQYSPATGGLTRDLPSPVSPVDGEWFSSPAEILEGVTVSGWLRFAVPDTAERAELVIRPSTGFNEEGFSHRWSMRLPVESLPDVGVASVSVPETIELGETIEYEIVVENTGGSARTETYDYQFGTGMGARTDEFTVSVPAGESVTETITRTPTGLGEVVFAFGDDEYTTEVVRPQRAFGESVTFETGLSMTVDEVAFGGEYATEVDTDSRFSDPVEAAGGRQFCFASVTVTNDADEEVSAPRDWMFTAVVDGDAYEPVSELDKTLARPVEGDLYQPVNLSPGEERTAWLIFEVPDGVRQDSVAIDYHNDAIGQAYTAVWRSG